ncbi:proline-rich transmembrane protein 1-like [Amphiura filiformis]|uniref:proline-rich transmembrane protein 1-like n=1 Tax=Amphiura filiformis TaxID=82378 RepID=UPI003B21E489
MDSVGYSYRYSYPAQQGYPRQQQGYRPQRGYPPSGNAQYYPNAPTQNTIVRAPQSTPPNDRLAFAIFVTICCCLPFGIVGIVQAMNVRSRFASGDVAGAVEASRSAKCWSIAGLVTGIVFQVIGIVLLIIYAVVGFSFAFAYSDRT